VCRVAAWEGMSRCAARRRASAARSATGRALPDGTAAVLDGVAALLRELPPPPPMLPGNGFAALRGRGGGLWSAALDAVKAMGLDADEVGGRPSCPAVCRWAVPL
jgi:hypothetical protein